MRGGVTGGVSREELAGLRATRQRRAILEVVGLLGVFASAQQVQAALEDSGRHVGLSTVYRCLHLLAENGLIDAVRDPGGEMLYRRCGGEAHHHLVCRICGRAVEIPAGPTARLVRQMARAEGFSDTEHALVAFGTCPDCGGTA